MLTNGMKKYLCLLLIIAYTIPLEASVLDSKISLQETNITIIELLNKIEKILDVTFSFKSTIIDQNAVVSVNCTGESLSDLLVKVINDETIGFYAIGTQVIIFKKETALPSKPKPASPPSPQKDTVVILRTDTVYKTDTVRILLRDTVTVLLTDTVTVEKTITVPEPIKQPLFLSLSYRFYQDINRPETNLSEGILLKNNTVSHQACYITGGMQREKFSLKTGIGVVRLAAKGTIDYNATVTRSEISEYSAYEYSYDSLWVSSGTDTSWYVVSDSSLQAQTDTTTTTDTVKGKKKYRATHSYLSIPVLISYKYDINRRLSLNATVGLFSHIAISKRTEHYTVETISKEREINPVYLDGTLSLDIEYSIFETCSITAGSSFYRQLTPIYSDDNSRSCSIGFSLGIKKYF